jgi:hypothetical protein
VFGCRSLPSLALAVLLALAVAPACNAGDILRLKPVADSNSRVSLWADHINSWTEGSEEVYALSGKVLIQQDQLEVRAERAIVWVDAEARKKRKPIAVCVYADKFRGEGVRIESRELGRKEADAAVIEFTTAAVASVRGVEQKSPVNDSPVYKEALAARGKPVPMDKPAPGNDPALLQPESLRRKQPLEGRATPAKDSEVEPAQFVRPPGPGGPGDPGAEPTPTPVSGPTVLPIPIANTRTLWISPRTTRPFNAYPVKSTTETAYIVTGGIKLMAGFSTGAIRSIEMEADQLVIWLKGKDAAPTIGAMQSKEGHQIGDGVEVYLTGNVIIRYGSKKDIDVPGTPTKTGTVALSGVPNETRTLRADRVYYDVSNHRAIAIGADMEYTRQNFQNAGHVVAPEIQQLSSTEFTAFEAVIHASRLPSDPAFTLNVDRADIYREPRRERTTFLGIPFRNRRTGEVLEEDPEILETQNFSIHVEDVPVFWLPSTRTDVNDPFGPFNGVTFRRDSIYGYQLYATWDMLKIIGLTKLEGERWSLLTDYMSIRGPALGTNYSRNSTQFMDMYAPFQTSVKGYILDDQGHDVIGGPREKEFMPPGWRGRLTWRYQQDFSIFETEDFAEQHQFSYLSDRNFLEQYYSFEQHYGPNQETFLWLKYNHQNMAATFLVEGDVGHKWWSETFWLPRVDGYLLGQSFADRFTYHTWGSVGFARLDPARNPPNEFPLGFDNGTPPPEVPVNTGRLDWMQQVAMPFEAGPFKVAPYGVLDLAYYTQDNTRNERGRVYGGGGVRASVPFSHLYRDVESELFNVQGLYHKNEFTANYFIAGSSASWAILPQLDRLNDEATESAWTDITPWQQTFSYLSPRNAAALTYGSYNIFNPREYAIRRLVDTRPDTLDDIQALQLGWNQRLQTKRGYTGVEHTVDWLVLDTSATVFPAANRDNFGSTVGFLEYHLIWNVGDVTSFYSNGWYDPFEFGARYCEVGTNFQRDDRTTFNVSYRTIDPIHTRLVSAVATYAFSPKYAITAITAYDFGTQASLTNIFQFTRIGTDLQITLGVTYNSIINKPSLTLSVIPTLAANQNTISGQGNGLGGSSRNSGR